MPCVTASPADVESLMAAIESDPSSLLELDLNAMTARIGGRQLTVTLPPAARESFLDGSWDATGLLLDRFEEVQAVAARLPYVSGWGR